MSGRTIVINCEKLETRVAFLNNDQLEEYQVERKTRDIVTGSIYWGRIEGIQHSLNAVFVDIGTDKNAFMHFYDMLPATYEESNIRKTSKEKKITVEDIPELFPVGSYLPVQVTKGPIGTKGARVTSNVSLPGRYLVLMPYSDHVGISKRIKDKKERDRIKKILMKLKIPQGMGCICRTVGEGRKALFFQRDLKMLLKFWNDIEEKTKKNKRPVCLYREMSLVEKSMRDFLTEDIDCVMVDDKKSYEFIREFIGNAVNKNLTKNIKLYQKAAPIFEYYGINRKINKIFDRKVYLPSGGHICIDETEAMIAIDINTGSTKSKTEMEETILNTNIEAADEIARQLRLRDIGGLVVIDFIDMRSLQSRETVVKRMRRLMRNDRAKTRILPISQLGLMEMTRQRDQESLFDRIYSSCPYCNGSGKVKSPLSVSVDIQRVLKEILKRKTWDKSLEVRVIMHPAVFARMKNEDDLFLKELEDQYGRDLTFRSEPSIHIEKFKVVDPNTGEDLLEYTKS
ncbi:MAG: Rne/Rng family ribonuclease [Victivallales bacterium]|nr:Rne/Rng family ribonuclease [Victivallales bacterium]